MEKLTIFDKAGNPAGSITFNPFDFGLVFRSEQLEKKIAQIVEPLAHVNIKPDGTGKGPHDSAVLEIAEKQFYEAFDEYLQPENSTQDLFMTRRPFASVRNEFYCLTVRERIVAYIVRRTAEQSARFYADHPALLNELDRKPVKNQEKWRIPENG